MRRFKAGLASAPAAGFMVTYNKHTLSLDDLGTLEEQNWLNDQVSAGPQLLKGVARFVRCIVSWTSVHEKLN